jgi:hypothetical protein
VRRVQFQGRGPGVEKLVQVVDLGADLLARRQRHQHQLTVLRGVKNPAEVVVADGQLPDVRNESFHWFSLVLVFVRLVHSAVLPQNKESSHEDRECVA